MSSPEPAADAPAPLAEPVLARQNRLRLSIVWLVPIVALVVGAVLVVRSLRQSGPEVTIEFHSAEGIEAGRTEVRFKEVVVGRVARVTLSPDRQKVRVAVRLDRSVENIAVEDTRFWVVRPRIGTAGVSGLGTLLSGAYIAVDAGAAEESRQEFTGLDAPPLVLRGEPGRSFVLDADDLGSLDVGAPVYHRRIRVGRVVGYALDASGRSLTVSVFIEAPHESLVTPRTRFWHASGIEVQLNAGGVTVNTQSVASVLTGGIAFGRRPDVADEAAAPSGQSFKLFASERIAMAPEDGEPLRVRMLFGQSTRGLEPGAAVDLLGVEVGTVRTIALEEGAGADRLPVAVTADLFPLRLGRLRERFQPPGGDTAHHDVLMLAQLVGRGLRAQLRSGNLLTGSLYVALDFVPKAPRARFDATATVPTLPTVPGALEDMQAQLAETLNRLSKVRFDEIGNELQGTLKSAAAAGDALQRTLSGTDSALRELTPQAKQSLAELQQTLAAAQRALGSAERNLADPDAPVQRQAGQTLAEMQRAASALRSLADYLQRHPESLLRGKAADAEPGRTSEAPR